MKDSQPFFDDLLTLGSSLFGNFSEVRETLQAQAKSGVGEMTRRLDLVGREEFDAAFAMIAKARAMQEALSERVGRIEQHLNLSRAGKNKNAAKPSLRSVKQGKKTRGKK